MAPFALQSGRAPAGSRRIYMEDDTSPSPPTETPPMSLDPAVAHAQHGKTLRADFHPRRRYTLNERGEELCASLEPGEPDLVPGPEDYLPMPRPLPAPPVPSLPVAAHTSPPPPTLAKPVKRPTTGIWKHLGPPPALWGTIHGSGDSKATLTSILTHWGRPTTPIWRMLCYHQQGSLLQAREETQRLTPHSTHRQ